MSLCLQIVGPFVPPCTEKQRASPIRADGGEVLLIISSRILDGCEIVSSIRSAVSDSPYIVRREHPKFVTHSASGQEGGVYLNVGQRG